MKLIFVAGLTLLASPLAAQTTSPDPAPMSSDVPNTTLSTSPTPSDGPRAQEANLPSNSAASANNSAMATAPETTVPEAPLASYPICKAGEFDHCMEPGNHNKAKRLKRTHK